MLTLNGDSVTYTPGWVRDMTLDEVTTNCTGNRPGLPAVAAACENRPPRLPGGRGEYERTSTRGHDAVAEFLPNDGGRAHVWFARSGRQIYISSSSYARVRMYISFCARARRPTVVWSSQFIRRPWETIFVTQFLERTQNTYYYCSALSPPTRLLRYTIILTL